MKRRRDRLATIHKERHKRYRITLARKEMKRTSLILREECEIGSERGRERERKRKREGERRK